MEVSRRIISFVLATVMLASVCLCASSCKAKGSAVKTVSETDPWYTSKRVELDPEFDPEICMYVSPNGPFKCHDKYVMTYSVSEKNPDIPGNYGITRDLMGIFDEEGTLLHMIDLYDIMSKMPSTFRTFSLLKCCESEKGVRLYFVDSGFLATYCCDIDLESGCQTGDSQTLDYSAALNMVPDGGWSDDYCLFSFSLIEDYEVIVLSSYSGSGTKLVVARDMKAIQCIDLQKALGPGEGAVIFEITGIGNGMAVFNSFGKSNLWVKLELATGNVTKITDVKPVPMGQTLSSSPDGKGYLTKATGIYEYDLESGEEKIRLNFDCCNVNRFETQFASVIDIDENKVIIACPPVITAIECNLLPPPAVVYTLEKTDKNPNAGKKLLTVASLSDSLTNAESEALKIFNDQNQEYYAQLILYEQNDYITAGDVSYGIDATDRNRYSAMALVSGSLTSDIRSGMGPDIVLGAAQSVDLFNSSYLTDLTPYLKSKAYDPSAYYSNIIEAARMDGKTYYIPTEFAVTGILTDGSKLDNDRKGFTYEEYASFVKEQLNGAEPVTRKSSRMHFLNLCVQRNYAQWLKDGKIDFDQEGFIELASFFEENIPEGISESNWISEDRNQEPEYAVFIEDISCLKSLACNNFFGENITVTGLPSSDGKGLSAIITGSFSITAGSPVEEGAYMFLDILLSEDSQKKSKQAIPVNRAAVMYRMERETEDNRRGYIRVAGNTAAGFSEWVPPEDQRDEAVFDPEFDLQGVFLDMIENVDSIQIPDNSVLMIISEEMPPYLIGQKDIGSVISAINSRTQVVFSER